MDRIRAPLALLLALTLAAAGCTGGAVLGGAAMGAAATAGGYQYVKGQYKTDYRHAYEDVFDATVASLEESNMPIVERQKDAAGANLKAQRPDGTDVWIDLKRTAPEVTEATIRVGYVGDEAASRAIANSIAEKLGEAPEVGRGGE